VQGKAGKALAAVEALVWNALLDRHPR